MAIEQTEMPGFTAYPATPPTIGPIRPIDTTTSTARVTLSGNNFSVKIQISNAQDSTTPPHLYVPPAESFETYQEVTTPDAPTDIPQPVRWVRLVVVSGSVTSATIAQTSQRQAAVSTAAVQEAVDQRIAPALSDVQDKLGQTQAARDEAVAAAALAQEAAGQFGSVNTQLNGVTVSNATAAPLGGSLISLTPAQAGNVPATVRPADLGGILVTLGGTNA